VATGLHWRLGGLAALAIAFASLPANAQGATPTGNLVANPSAEASAGTIDPNVATPPSGWTASAGLTAIRYGTEEFPPIAHAAQLRAGVNFFAGGLNVAESTATQTIDVSSAAAEIDANVAKATLTALLGGYRSQSDNARVVAQMLGTGGAALGSITVGPVSPTERDGVTSLMSRTATAKVPPGTRTIVVTIIARRTEGTFNDGYADNISLTLAGDGGPDVPDCVVTVALSDGARMPYCQNLAIGDPQPQVTRAVIVQHGKGRSVQSYFDSMRSAAGTSGATTKTIIIAPYFQKGSNAPSSQLRWGEWKWGERSSSGFGLARRSSFEVYDEFVAMLANKSNFPNLEEIVIAGHSAGGQFAQRYAAFSKAALTVQGPKLRYVVANPSSYVYMNGKRWINGKFRGLREDQRLLCRGWDDYGYGLDKRKRYVAGRSQSQVRKDYSGRRVTYLLGEDDNKRDSDLDKTCEADYQGRNRLRRGKIFMKFMDKYHPANVHSLVTVPGVAHSGGEMFKSPEGRAVIFAP
jgi:pimeloyl-ACP methyl ester carboxylesterase